MTLSVKSLWQLIWLDMTPLTWAKFVKHVSVCNTIYRQIQEHHLYGCMDWGTEGYVEVKRTDRWMDGKTSRHKDWWTDRCRYISPFITHQCSSHILLELMFFLSNSLTLYTFMCSHVTKFSTKQRLPGPWHFSQFSLLFTLFCQEKLLRISNRCSLLFDH